jgi:tetratricopeptide (TPR) repeat protein
VSRWYRTGWKTCAAKCTAEAQRDPGNDDWQRELSVARNSVGRILQLQKHLTRAQSQYEAAKQIREELVARQPENDNRRYDLAISYNFIGAILEDQDKLPEALKRYNAAKRILEALAGHDSGNTNWAHALAVSYRKVGAILQKQVRSRDALKEYEAGKKIIQELTKRDPINVAWRHELSVLHHSVGRTLQEEAPDKALEEFTAGKRILRELTSLDQNNADWSRDLYVLQSSVGEVLQKQGLLDEASEEYEASKQIMQNLIARYPDNPEWRLELSVSRRRLSVVLLAQHKTEAALLEYNLAEEVQKELLAREHHHNVAWRPIPFPQTNLSPIDAPPTTRSAAPPEHDWDWSKQSTSRPPVARKRIFISYCSKDISLRRELETHLIPLRIEGLIDVWTDTRISLGADWSREIDDNLKRANLILLLLSSEYLGSEYCEMEMGYALRRHETAAACVVPILAGGFSWQRLPAAKLQVLPRDRQPVDREPKSARDHVWTEIVEEIRKYLVMGRSDAS